jgi:hypothetical protein
MRDSIDTFEMRERWCVTDSEANAGVEVEVEVEVEVSAGA